MYDEILSSLLAARFGAVSLLPVKGNAQRWSMTGWPSVGTMTMMHRNARQKDKEESNGPGLWLVGLCSDDTCFPKATEASLLKEALTQSAVTAAAWSEMEPIRQATWEEMRNLPLT